MKRRSFLAAASAASLSISLPARQCRAALDESQSKMAFGLVTYMWGADWDLPTLIANCEKAEVHGVELRTTHKHGVEPSLTKKQRSEVAARFGDSAVTLVGLGSNERFDDPDPAVVEKSIEASKQFVILSHDIGGTGVKVKPDSLHKEVPREKTIEQIGRALNTVGEFAAGYGQQIRLEIHGGCADLPTIKAIMDVADHESVAICWNSNPQDLEGEGLAHNFDLVRKRFGQTVHTRPVDDKSYPYAKLIELLAASDYSGWIMLEDGRVPKDPAAELARQRKLFDELVASVRG